MAALIGAVALIFTAVITGGFGVWESSLAKPPNFPTPSSPGSVHEVNTSDGTINVAGFNGNLDVQPSAHSGGVAVVGGRGHTFHVQAVTEPEPEPVAKPRLTDIGVEKFKDKVSRNGRTVFVEYPESTVIVFTIDNNMGTAPTTITKVRFRLISFEKETGGIGGASVIERSAKYAIDLAKLRKNHTVIELNVGHQLAPGEADSFEVIATDSGRKNVASTEKWTWKLGVTLVTSEGDLPEREFIVRLPN